MNESHLEILTARSDCNLPGLFFCYVCNEVIIPFWLIISLGVPFIYDYKSHLGVELPASVKEPEVVRSMPVSDYVKCMKGKPAMFESEACMPVAGLVYTPFH